jgi:hypothetical protein
MFELATERPRIRVVEAVSALTSQSGSEEAFAMTNLIALAAVAVTLMLIGSASAQDKAQPSELKPTLNCHPPSNGAPAWDSQDIGKSAILPSADGDTTTGAASTVQRHGLSVEVRSDCPPELSAPIAGKPNR